MIVPDGEIRHAVQNGLEARDIPLSSILLLQDLRIEGITVDVVADPQKERRLVGADSRPDRLQPVVHVART
jgi:hypothetical protein